MAGSTPADPAAVELKACPFCGAKDNWLDADEMRVECRLCMATMPYLSLDHDPVTRWNARVHQSPPVVAMGREAHVVANTQAAINAADAYWRDKATHNGELMFALPGGFFWCELLEAALNAASTPTEGRDGSEVAREALAWALPLAERALEEHRSERLRCGHSDIGGTDAKGNVIVGLWQSEIDQRDRARAALSPAMKKEEE